MNSLITKSQLKTTLLEFIRRQHVFNKLDERTLLNLNESFKLSGIDCFALCRKHGITYTINRSVNVNKKE